ncbi:copper resistance protein B [Aliifodinibius sp. S!AR15-10]|uniref:copper resistance protein B n=1 Tax=Aliifodinibius sp. S!AR15-10 TaxID=2950437 RepID=UPI002858AD52|nr:copper resistance protein B [Aliifodinibius sp. S!AR15-10]MDR8391439.1 copper resistance protein B [Aliifodinibius sp. S!AR15-10]
MTIIKRASLFILTTVVIIVMAGSSALAQKAPEFSNDLMMDDKTYVYLIAEKLEYRSVSGINPLMWEVQGYVGKDLNKFWFKSHGEALTTEREAEMEFQGLYSRAIGPYFDIQGGIRYDLAYEGGGNKSRGFAVIGLQGMAPYFFHVDGGMFFSEDGDISASLEAVYDLLFTQRLIGQPVFETSIAVQEVSEWGVGSGFNNIGLGFRLRYEFAREFAPYIGINWERKLGETAEMARAGGGNASNLSLLGGVRMWF